MVKSLTSDAGVFKVSGTGATIRFVGNGASNTNQFYDVYAQGNGGFIKSDASTYTSLTLDSYA